MKEQLLRLLLQLSSLKLKEGDQNGQTFIINERNFKIF